MVADAEFSAGAAEAFLLQGVKRRRGIPLHDKAAKCPSSGTRESRTPGCGGTWPGVGAEDVNCEFLKEVKFQEIPR